MVKNLRVFFRVNASFPLQIKTAKQEATAKTVNISLSGIAFEFESSLEIGDQMIIECRLPRQIKKVQMQAQVVRVQEVEAGKYLIAVQFFGMDPFVSHRLSQFILQKFTVVSARFLTILFATMAMLVVLSKPVLFMLNDFNASQALGSGSWFPERVETYLLMINSSLHVLFAFLVFLGSFGIFSNNPGVRKALLILLMVGVSIHGFRLGTNFLFVHNEVIYPIVLGVELQFLLSCLIFFIFMRNKTLNRKVDEIWNHLSLHKEHGKKA